MKFAIVPWAEFELKDIFFGTYDTDDKLILSDTYRADMYTEFLRLGHEVHTIDMYENLNEVDFFLIFPIDCWNWTNKLMHMGLGNRMVYCNAEPPSVIKRNSPKGYRLLRQIFPYILTWNSVWVDNESIFRKHTQYRFENRFGNIPFRKRKLLTAISGNKRSKHSNELYSERDKVYTYFECNYPNQFDFYGSGWNTEKKPHICYKGYAANKESIFHQYRFAVCFENTAGLCDYVTEKILDCICSGIVPIYAGAPNIKEYIPEECFIDYYKFSSIDELAQYITSMSEEEYNKYLDAMSEYIDSDAKYRFSGELYARDIVDAVQHNKDFMPSIRGILYVKYQTIIEKMASVKMALLRKSK